jgi:hypothetical protein
MEDRVDPKVEQELRGYLSARLDRIAVRSTPRFAARSSGWLRSVAAVPLTLLLLGGAIVGGVALGEWREQRMKESPVAGPAIPGPLALGDNRPSAGFGLVSTTANTLLIRSEDREDALRAIPNALPLVAIAPNGKDVAFWRVTADPKATVTTYELHIVDVTVGSGTPGAVQQVALGPAYLTVSDEMPSALRWSSDGTGVIAGTRTFVRRGAQAPRDPDHSTWFAIDVVTRNVDRLDALESKAVTVYAWDRQRDLITAQGVDGTKYTWLSLSAGRLSSWELPDGAMVSDADSFGRSAVLVSHGACGARTTQLTRCPAFDIREQATFTTLLSFSPVTTPVGDAVGADVRFRPRSQDLIVQLRQPNGEAHVELWSDLGRGAHSLLATYAPNAGFTATTGIVGEGPRELILPRVDGSAVFLLKFDDRAGGRWFGEIVDLAPNLLSRGIRDPQRTPFEIRTGGNPIVSVVLDPTFSAALATVPTTPNTAPNTKGSPPASQTPSGTPRGCPDGRPQPEITAAGLLPYEPDSPLLLCVLIAESTSRVFRLTDGRNLQVFEYVGVLPAKPAASPVVTGTRTIGSQSWSWSVVNAQTVLSTTFPGVYVELSVPMGSNTTVSTELESPAGRALVDAEVDLLQSIASTLRRSN